MGAPIRSVEFPPDIEGCLKSCILAVIWPKREIIAFFRRCNCTDQDLGEASKFRALQLSRAAIVDTAFLNLERREDKGLGQFRAILRALINWEHFDPYYFDKLKKLDKQEAQRTLGHLRQLQEIRDARVKEESRRREVRKQGAPASRELLEGLRRKFLELHQGKTTPQRRGYELEHILLDLANLVGLEVTEPFRTGSEQIDGAFKYDGEHYILEAKWQEAAASNEPLYQFAFKVEGKMYGRGVFVSINGYSTPAIADLYKGKAIRTILVDGEDLVLTLEGQLTFAEMIDRKIKAAQTRGRIYIHPVTGQDKQTAD
jgi:hypothetical protein